MSDGRLVEEHSHAVRIGLDSGKEPEGLDGLPEGHARPIERAATSVAGGTKERRFKRDVDDLATQKSERSISTGNGSPGCMAIPVGVA